MMDGGLNNVCEVGLSLLLMILVGWGPFSCAKEERTFFSPSPCDSIFVSARMGVGGGDKKKCDYFLSLSLGMNVRP